MPPPPRCQLGHRLLRSTALESGMCHPPVTAAATVQMPLNTGSAVAQEMGNDALILQAQR